MAITYRGMEKVLYIRDLKQDATASGLRLALQTTHTLAAEVSSTATVTKDGTENSIGTPAYTLDMSYLGSDDEMNELIEDLMNNGRIMEFWEVNFNKPEHDTPDNTSFAVRYGRGYITSWSGEDGAEDNETISVTVAVNGVPQKGYCEVPAEDLEALQYAFTCLQPQPVLTLTPATESVAVGSTVQLTSSRVNGISVKSSDTRVASASVDAAVLGADTRTITVTGNYAGTATITLTADDGVTATATVTVTAE
jgi:TP901-1 family phage major tail protein